jgi:hypothetical protein
MCAGVGFKIKKLYTRPMPKKFSLRVDSRFSKKMSERLTTFAKEHEKVSLSSHFFSLLAKETFPAIESITLKNHIAGQVLAKVKAAKPLALVNKDFVLASNNRLVERDTFPEHDVKELPAFYVSQTLKHKEQLELSGRCKAFIRQFDRSLLKKYDVQWVNGTLVLLRDHKHPNMTMLIDDKTNVTPSLRLAYEGVKEKNLKKQTKSKGRDWFVDMRFRNQVIVFPKGAKG